MVIFSRLRQRPLHLYTKIKVRDFQLPCRGP